MFSADEIPEFGAAAFVVGCLDSPFSPSGEMSLLVVLGVCARKIEGRWYT